MAVKDDNGKLRYDLIDDDAEAEVVGVLTFGAEKYSPNGWRKIDALVERYFAAARRHMRDFRQARRGKGTVIDPESRMHVLAHAICCLQFILADDLARHPEIAETIDDRLREGLAIARLLREQREQRAKDVA